MIEVVHQDLVLLQTLCVNLIGNFFFDGLYDTWSKTWKEYERTQHSTGHYCTKKPVVQQMCRKNKLINQILGQACVALLALGFVSGQQQQQEGGHRRDQVSQQLDP